MNSLLPHSVILQSCLPLSQTMGVIIVDADWQRFFKVLDKNQLADVTDRFQFLFLCMQSMCSITDLQYEKQGWESDWLKVIQWCSSLTRDLNLDLLDCSHHFVQYTLLVGVPIGLWSATNLYNATFFVSKIRCQAKFKALWEQKDTCAIEHASLLLMRGPFLIPPFLWSLVGAFSNGTLQWGWICVFWQSFGISHNLLLWVCQMVCFMTWWGSHWLVYLVLLLKCD